jgi:TldD protein
MKQSLLDSVEYAIKYLEKFSSYAEARLESSDSSGFMMKNGLLEASSQDSYHGAGFRFIIGKSLGFFSTDNLAKKNIKKLAEKSIRATKKAARLAEPISLGDEKRYSAKYDVKDREKISDFSPDRKVSLLKEINSALSKSAAERYFSIHDCVTEKYFINTSGSRIFSRIPRISFYYNFSVLSGGKSSQRSWMYGASAGYEILRKWNLPETLSRESEALLKNLAKGVRPPRGKVDVVCAPEIVAIMVHESAGHPGEADRVLGREAAQAGESFMTPAMLNTRIGSDLVNIADDPTIPGSYGYYLYDDEGVKARKRMLIQGGMINEFLQNRETASFLGVQSNGAARAVNYSVEPIVRMANTYFVPGKQKEEELIESVKLGVYMKNFMEWNIDDVRLNQKYVGAEAYLIKNGRIVAPVVKPVIETTTPALYSSVSGVADNLEFHSGTCGKGEPMQAIPVWFGGPTIKLSKMEVLPRAARRF